MDEQSGQQPRETWRRVGPSWVKATVSDPATDPEATVLLLPGLGLPRYTERTGRALLSLGLRCVTLDLLAWRRPHLRVPPRVLPMGEAAARFASETGLGGPLVVVGHSTGAQAALEAALRLQHDRADVSVVLAGLTFQPSQRSRRGLLQGAATAYRKDSLRELVALKNLARVRGDVVRIVRSGQRDSPEERVRSLRVPLVLTAGEADSFAPREWMDEVAAAAGGPSRVAVLPGSHNNLFTHPEEFAAVVAGAACSRV